MFADYISLSKHIIHQTVSNNELQDDLNTINEWARKWQVTFNPLKSEAILMSLRPNNVNIHNFTFQNHNITHVDEHKHLGLIWNRDATWRGQLSSVISKACKHIALKFKLKWPV